ncbi:uncharacterized protein DFL_005291 [Arthrobotrys flagrans]|uniref:Uncharacterized protein n=1 Tax=Arthrobotrys flagrans TaxID=97331 RepID=A0A437A7D8_ARTFL|nr:hypothetical protein DFL_005291 [Arthrobotrys flagrans]
MKTALFTTFVVGMSSLLVTPTLGHPVGSDVGGLEYERRGNGDEEPDIRACSSQVESLLTMRRWEGGPEKILQQQKEYLTENRGKLPRCVGFEEGSVQECVILGKESSNTLPDVYINHICQLLR